MCVRYACGLLSWYMRARLGVGLDGRLLLGDGCRQWKPNKIEWLLPRTDCTPVCACVRCEVWGVSALGVLCARMRGGVERPWRAPPHAHRGMRATADVSAVEA